MTKQSYYFIVLFAFLIVSSCKKKQESETDNLFKFKEYVSYHTNGVQSIANNIVIGLSQPLEQYEVNQEVSSDYLKISPKVKGKLVVENSNTLTYVLDEYLKPDQEYEVSLSLNKLYDGVSSEFKKYVFAFKTIKPSFKINLGNLQSYSKNLQYLTGSLEASDVLNAEKIAKTITAKKKGKALSIKWKNTETDSQFYEFTIDSIPRAKDDTKIEVSWNGKSVGAQTKGSEEFLIPGLSNFSVVDIRSTGTPNPVLTLNFSEPLDESQNLKGLVTIQNNPRVRFEIDGNVLRVYPENRIVGEVKINAYTGIKSAYGVRLKKSFSQKVSFEQIKPAVRLLSKGTILPNATSTPIYFETAGLKAVEVRVIQVFENNMLQYLQNNNSLSSTYSNLRPVGRRVAYKLIDLQKDNPNDTGYWKAHALNLSELIKANPGSLYRVEFSFKKEHTMYECQANAKASDENDYYYEDDYYYDEDNSYVDAKDEDEETREQMYWDNQLYNWRKYTYNYREKNNPCHLAYYNDDRIARINLLGSDLGLIAKKGKNQSYHFVATNLLTAKPEKGATVKVYNYQKQELASLTTDKDGVAIYDADNVVTFAVVQKGNHYAYAKMEDGNAISMSKFDIAGQTLQKGLQGFLYTERGVHRPGDPIHLTFVLDDKSNPLPNGHPVSLEVTDPRGKLVQRTILNDDFTAVNKVYFAKKQGKFYYFPIPTQPESPTGSWNATVKVGGAKFSKSLQVATVKPNRLKIKWKFDDEILDISKNVTGTLESTWLHGAPARNLNYDVEAKFTQATDAFPKYKQYTFKDPVRSFTEMEKDLASGKLTDQGIGNINEKLNISKKAPGMLRATFTTKVYEGGGDFSIDVYNKKLAPFSHFVGLQSPKARRYGSFYTDEKTTFDVVSLSAQGKPAPQRKLKVQVYKIQWRWWWNRGYDNLSRYENASVHTPYKQYTVTTNSSAKGSFSVNIPENDGGRFLIRVIDEASGHATGRIAYFYRNWWRRPSSGDAESAKMLVFSADKEKYELGETATVSFPSDKDGYALISVENGSEVLSTQWVPTNAVETKANIKITPEMAPNAYINISLLQPHEQVKNDLPIRLYGVVPVLVDNPETHLQPVVSMPEVLKPEEEFTISVSEANKKAMTYTVAVVDEGLLDLTRFGTPDIHSSFYSRQALGVKTFDVFDEVMGAYSISVDNIYAIGGGGIADGAKNRKAERFKPVVNFIGPFKLKVGETAKHTLQMPNYVGSVRTMVIAGNWKSAYGNAEKTTPVRKPLMVLTSLPRKLSPGEKVTIPVTVFAMEKKVKNVDVKVSVGKGLKPIGSTSKNLRFNSIGEQIVNFEFEVLPTDTFEKIQVLATGAGETARDELEIDIENPNPYTQVNEGVVLEPNASQTINFETFGVAGTNSAFVEFSTLPPMDLSRRLDYLIRYPHGCVEQTTSAVFPQLFLTDVLDISSSKKQELVRNIKNGIKKLGNFQNPDGGLSYWPGYRSTSDWGTSYAGHFMIEAKQKGYTLPISFLSNWLTYQKNAARQWTANTTGYRSDLAQAYRLYTLALAGQPELSAMNRLRETVNLSNDAKWRLAAAYALIGKKSVASNIAAKANIDFKPYRYDYHTYGSPFRNRAMALETMVLIGQSKQREMAISLAKDLSSQKWYSTQETAYGILALSKMVNKNGGKSLNLELVSKGKKQTVKTERAIAQRDISIGMGSNSITVNNKQGNQLFVTLSKKGKLPLGEELADSKNLSLRVNFYDAANSPIQVNSMRQGTEITAKIVVSNTSADAVDNIALTQILPSGWEIVDTSFTDGGSSTRAQADYVDIRDDRIYYYFDLAARKTKTFTVKLNASYLGNYYLPGTQVEAMYDNNYYARNKGQWITVEN